MRCVPPTVARATSRELFARQPPWNGAVSVSLLLSTVAGGMRSRLGSTKSCSSRHCGSRRPGASPGSARDRRRGRALHGRQRPQRARGHGGRAVEASRAGCPRAHPGDDWDPSGEALEQLVGPIAPRLALLIASGPGPELNANGVNLDAMARAASLDVQAQARRRGLEHGVAVCAGRPEFAPDGGAGGRGSQAERQQGLESHVGAKGAEREEGGSLTSARNCRCASSSTAITASWRLSTVRQPGAHGVWPAGDA